MTTIIPFRFLDCKTGKFYDSSRMSMKEILSLREQFPNRVRVEKEQEREVSESKEEGVTTKRKKSFKVLVDNNEEAAPE